MTVTINPVTNEHYYSGAITNMVIKGCGQLWPSSLMRSVVKETPLFTFSPMIVATRVETCHRDKIPIIVLSTASP